MASSTLYQKTIGQIDRSLYTVRFSTSSMTLNSTCKNIPSDGPRYDEYFRFRDHCIVGKMTKAVTPSVHEMWSRPRNIGQLKLLSMEILFLTMYYDVKSTQNALVVYIGAAPGDHLVQLMKMFPKINFSLYDSSAFSDDLKEYINSQNGPMSSRQIELNEKLFNDDDVQRCINYSEMMGVYFISDIRQMMYKKAGNEYDPNASATKIVEEDMRLQEKWVLDINPKATMLKFKLPRGAEVSSFTYIKGILFKQPWTKENTNELRLMASRDDNYISTTYNNIQVNKINDIINYSYRNGQYISPFTNTSSYILPECFLTNDYDSVYLTCIIKMYIKKHHPTISNTDLHDQMIKILKFTTAPFLIKLKANVIDFTDLFKMVNTMR